MIIMGNNIENEGENNYFGRNSFIKRFITLK